MHQEGGNFRVVITATEPPPRLGRVSPWPDLVRLSTSSGQRLSLPQDMDCMVTAPDIGGRRRALRSWMGLVDRGYLGPAGVTVEHANGRLGSRPHTIRRADQDADVYLGEL